MTEVSFRNPESDHPIDQGGGVGGYNYDDYGYDPAVLPPEDTDWLEDCRVIGFNDETGKAFISGPGSYVDHGCMTCGPGDDPNCPAEVEELTCYNEIMPFHWDCYRLLSRRLARSDETGNLNKAILLRVMTELVEDEYSTALQLDYVQDVVGIEFLTGEQAWGCNPGEELYVCSPLPTPKLTSAVWTEFCQAFSLPSVDQSLSSRVKSDNFNKLPTEIVDQILLHLDHHDLVAILQASWVVHSKVHYNNGFWKLRIQTKMPWFFELHEFLQHQDSTCLESMKGLYLWAQKTTVPRDGLRWPIMAISNRRRVWNVCDQLADLYFSNAGSS